MFWAILTRPHAWRRVAAILWDHVAFWIAKLLPRKVAYWAFIRVYASAYPDGGPDYLPVCRAWDDGDGR